MKIEIPQNVPRSANTNIPGWEHPAEETELMRYAARVREDGHILEVGSEYGRSAGAFRTGAKKSVTIHCVDIDPRSTQHWIPQNLKRANLLYNVTTYNANSREFDVVAETGVEQFDLIFIDGDHTEKGAYQDLKRFAPHLRLGGYLLLHDVAVETNTAPHPLHFEVLKAMTKWMGDTPPNSLSVFRIISTVETLVVLQRQPRHIEATK